MKDCGENVLCFLPSGVARAELGGVKNPRFIDAEGEKPGKLVLVPNRSCEERRSGSENRLGVDSEDAKKSMGEGLAAGRASMAAKSGIMKGPRSGRFRRRSRSSDEMVESCGELRSIDSRGLRWGEF